MKKIFAALMMSVIFPSVSFSSEGLSIDIKEPGISEYIIQRDMGNSIGFKTNDGLTVLYLGTFRAKQPEAIPQSPDAHTNTFSYRINIKRIRPALWSDWLYVEREYAVPLEEDRKRIEFEEFEVMPEK